MKNKNIIIGISVIVILTIVGILMFNNHQLKKELKNAYTIHSQLNDSIGKIQTIVTKYGDSLQVVNQIVASQQQAIEMGLIEKNELKQKYFKELNNVIKLKEEVAILNKPGEYINVVFAESADTVSGKDWLRLPAQMKFSDQWYNLQVTADRVPTLDSLFVWAEPEINIGYMKQGFLKRAKPVATYENKNPYIHLKDMQSLTIKENKKWYQTTSAKVGAGAVIGIVLTSLLTH